MGLCNGATLFDSSSIIVCVRIGSTSEHESTGWHGKDLWLSTFSSRLVLRGIVLRYVEHESFTILFWSE